MFALLVSRGSWAADVELRHLVATMARARLQRLSRGSDLMHLIEAWSFPKEALRGLVLCLGGIRHLGRLTESAMDRFCSASQMTVLSAKNGGLGLRNDFFVLRHWKASFIASELDVTQGDRLLGLDHGRLRVVHTAHRVCQTMLASSLLAHHLD